MFLHSTRTEDCNESIKKLGELEQTYIFSF